VREFYTSLGYASEAELTSEATVSVTLSELTRELRLSHGTDLDVWDSMTDTGHGDMSVVVNDKEAEWMEPKKSNGSTAEKSSGARPGGYNEWMELDPLGTDDAEPRRETKKRPPPPSPGALSSTPRGRGYDGRGQARETASSVPSFNSQGQSCTAPEVPSRRVEGLEAVGSPSAAAETSKRRCLEPFRIPASTIMDKEVNQRVHVPVQATESTNLRSPVTDRWAGSGAGSHSREGAQRVSSISSTDVAAVAGDASKEGRTQLTEDQRR